VLNFADFNDGVEQEEKVEYAENKVSGQGILQANSKICAHMRDMNCRVLRAYTASTAMTSWKMLVSRNVSNTKT
jgi:hypothetical protein